MPDRRAPLAACAAVAATAGAITLYSQVAPPWIVLGWIGLVPWLALLDATTSWRGTVLAGLTMCSAFVLAVFWWFVVGMQAYTGHPLAVVVLALVAVGPVILQPQLLPFALARRVARGRGASFWRTAIAGAGIYVGTEWAFPKLFADTLGHGLQASAWMRQAADLAGAPGLTFVLVIANECALSVVQALRRNDARAARAPAGVVAALVLALLGYGAWRERQPPVPAGPPITAAVVQADIAHYGQLAADVGTYEATRRILDAHFALSTDALAGGGVDVLVWPETVYPTTFGSPKTADGAALDREIAAFVASAHVPLIFGSYDLEDDDEYNAAVFLEPPSGGPLAFDTYRKASLFPLTERVPAWLEWGLIRRWLPWLGTWKPGRGAQVLPLHLADGRTIQVNPLICYDAVDPKLALAAARRGAEVMVTLSNDSWFPAGAHLHLVVAAFRSIETRRPQIRATNTGISAVIDANGELRAIAGVDVQTVLRATVTPVRSASTLMLAWGDWFGPTALGLGLLLVVLPGGRTRGARPVL